MKRVVRQALAGCVTTLGGSALLRRWRRNHLVILCYHRVLPVADRVGYVYPDLVVTPEDFAAQVAHCRRYYEVLPLREACAKLYANEGNQRDRPLLSITFDDGYRDNALRAAPILAQAGVRATFFIISSLIGAPDPPWYDRAARALVALEHSALSCTEPQPSGCADSTTSTYSGNAENRHAKTEFAPGHHQDARREVRRLKTLPDDQRREVVEDLTRRAAERGWQGGDEDRVMTASEIRSLADAGHEVASHTVSHPILTRTNSETCATELANSRKAIAELIDQDVVSLAYPNGNYHAAVLAAAREAGYQYATTTESGLNDAQTNPLALRRIFVSEPRLAGRGGMYSRAVFDFELTGAGDALFLRGPRGVKT